jgi:MFS family permease
VLLRKLSSFIKESDKRIKTIITGLGVYYWGQKLTTQYNSLYITSLGANPFQLGLLNSIMLTVSSIASIPLGWAIGKYSVKKVMLFGFTCAAISSIIFAFSENWWMLIPAFIISNRLVRMGSLSDMIFVSGTDPDQRATVMGISRVVWGILNLSAPIIASLIVAKFGGINFQGIRPLYLLQLVSILFVFIFISKFFNPLSNQSFKKHEKDSYNSNFIKGYLDFFKGEKWLKHYVLLRFVLMFGMNMAMPFASLWMVNIKNATPYTLGVMGTLSVITSLLLQIPVGRLSDRVGRKKMFFLLRPFCYFGTILMIFAPRPEYLIVVGVLGAIASGGDIFGGIGGVSYTPFFTMFYEMVPQEKRGRWFGIEGLLNLSTIPASILGGVLWQMGYKMEVMIIPIILELLIVIPLLAYIPETLKRPRTRVSTVT